MQKTAKTDFPENITLRDKYGPAMKMKTRQEAADWFQKCVRHTMRKFKKTASEAARIEKSNLGYYAGYYDQKIRARVERLFLCEHPIFGSVNKKVDAKEAYDLGRSQVRYK